MDKPTMRHRCGLFHWTATLLLAGTLAISGCSSDGEDGAAGPPGDPGTPGDAGTPGTPGLGIKVTDWHGKAKGVQATKGANNPANLCTTITSASVGKDGKLTVKFNVKGLGTATDCANANGAPYTTLAAANPAGAAQMTFRFAQLRPGDIEGDSSYWVNYINAPRERSKNATIKGPGTTPVGTILNGPGGEGSNTAGAVWTNHGNGSYTYVTAAVLTNGITIPAPVLPAGYAGDVPKSGTFPYDPNLPHRVALQMADPDGAAGPATMGANTPAYDFTPATGAAIADPREIVLVENCNECHSTLAFHGSRLDTKLCVTCHNATFGDPETGNSLDLKVMVHKIHMGKNLPSVGFDFAGDAAGKYNNDPAAAVTGTPYRIIGNALPTNFDYSGVGFPANVANCAKCHKDASEGANWIMKPTKEACGSCHDGINFEDGTGTRLVAINFPGKKIEKDPFDSSGHLGGPQADNSKCVACHQSIGPLPARPRTNAPVPASHDMAAKTKTDYDVAVTMSAPANGAFYKAGEAPVVTVVITDKTTGLPIDHSTLAGISANLYAYGPRALKKPVLTTAAKATPAPSTAGNSLASTTDSKVTRTGENVTYALDAIPATLQPGTYFIFVRVNKTGTLNSETVVLKEFQIGTATVEKQVAVCTTCHENTQWHDSPGVAQGNHPAPFNPDACGACHDYAAPAFAKLGLLADGSTTQWKGGGVCVNTNSTTVTTDDTVNTSLITQNDCLAGITVPPASGTVSERKWMGSVCVVGGVIDATVTAAAACTTAGGTWTGYTANNMGFGAAPIARRVHGVHAGKKPNQVLKTMNYPFEIYNGHNVAVVFPQDIKNCETCHTPATSGTWSSKPGRVACLSCHDSDAAVAHGTLMTVDPTPYADAQGTTLPGPFSGDERETCTVCHM